jgi:hypothetical protein
VELVALPVATAEPPIVLLGDLPYDFGEVTVATAALPARQSYRLVARVVGDPAVGGAAPVLLASSHP